jgi:hypothetical protein
METGGGGVGGAKGDSPSLFWGGKHILTLEWKKMLKNQC